MELSPDSTILWQWGPVKLNATILYTWIVMAILVIGSWLSTRQLSDQTKLTRRQNLLETLVSYMNNQIRSTSRQEPGRFLPFVGTLFLFIAFSNSLEIVPGFEPPTGSLSTTAALAICVFIAVPFYGILQGGVAGYLKHYIKHNERDYNRRHPAESRAAVFPHCHAGAWASDRADPGVHFCCACNGVYCIRDLDPEPQRRHGRKRIKRRYMIWITSGSSEWFQSLYRE